MIRTPTDKGLLRQFGQIRYGLENEFRPVRDWILDTKQSLAEANSTETDEVKFRWRQGALQMLNDLLKLIYPKEK